MNRKRLLLLPLLVVAFAGCGGKYHGSISDSSVNPFAGPYTSGYDAAFLENTGSFNLTIAEDGQVTRDGNGDHQGSGSVTGSISSDVRFSGTLSFPSNGTSADLTPEEDGVLTGTLTGIYHSGDGDVTGTVVVTPSPALN